MQNNHLDYLNGTNIYLRQRKDMFRCNTDTALLGHFMKVTKEDRVLDIGCNNGALMLFASQYNPQHIYGVDVFSEALELAQENLEYNKVKKYTLIQGDVTTLDLDKVDVIVCNPPYFNTDTHGNKNENEFLKTARHEGTLNLDSLFKVVSSTLNEGGRFYLVHRASRLNDILYSSSQYQLRAKTMQLMFDEDKDEAISVLLEFKKGYIGELHILKPKYCSR